MSVLRFHYMLKEFMHYLDYSHVNKLGRDGGLTNWYSSTEHQYQVIEDTIFEGYGTDKKWFSVNIKTDDYLYVHVSGFDYSCVKISPSSNALGGGWFLIDVLCEANFQNNLQKVQSLIDSLK